MPHFSGVVDGLVLSDESIAGTVVQRLLPNGSYTWRLRADGTERAESGEMSGLLTVKDADNALPQMTVFSAAPEVFSPNQDGIEDRAAINVYLTKEAELTVYLEGRGERFYIPERQEGRKLGEAGRHLFDYDGGIDRGSDPPPDGVYKVAATAEDAEGQIIQQVTTLTIEQGGKPLAEIVPQTVGVDVVFEIAPYEDRYLSSEDAGRPDCAPG
jgi:hypothetical protein